MRKTDKGQRRVVTKKRKGESKNRRSNMVEM